MYDEEVQGILGRLSIFNKMYQAVRFVDPIAKRVINCKNNELAESGDRCFDFWERDKICDNCVSIRAFNENRTFVKVEYGSENVFIVSAVPVELSDRRIVIELLNDGTHSLIFQNGNYNNSSEIYAMIDNMNNLALRDPLTGVYNRRYINEKLPIDLVNAALLQRDMSVIMADIDFFKKVNDTYGHLAGDEVLKSFAGIISGCLKRESDWVSRFGGEEFLICLPGAGLDKAAEVAEKMRMQVEATEIMANTHPIRITASFGVCTMKPVQGSKVDDFIELADKKLYLAKSNGRNRVEY